MKKSDLFNLITNLEVRVASLERELSLSRYNQVPISWPSANLCMLCGQYHPGVQCQKIVFCSTNSDTASGV